MRLLALLLALALCGGFLGWATAHQKAFDPDAWQAGQPDDSPVRIRMVEDLLRQHSFIGYSRKDVTRLLGEPDSPERWPSWDMAYWIGPYRGWEPEEAGWLLIRLKDERVAEIRRVTPPYTGEEPLFQSNPSLDELKRSLS